MAQMVLGLGTSHSPQLSPPQISGVTMGSGTSAIPICASQMAVSTPMKRCWPQRLRRSGKNSLRTPGKPAVMPARKASRQWAQSSRRSLLMSW